MPADLPIRCSCGALRAVVRSASGGPDNHVVCYCDDCQSFAHFLARAEDTIDANGGTEIFQMSPARLEIKAGADHLACVRLTPKGLLRWYAECCRTPIGNTLASRQVPFVGLVVRCIDPGSPSRGEVLGPIRFHLHTRFAKGDVAQPGASERAPASLLLRLAWQWLVARLRGDHRRSPFFDATGAPVSPPLVLGADERTAVRARAGFG